MIDGWEGAGSKDSWIQRRGRRNQACNCFYILTKSSQFGRHTSDTSRKSLEMQWFVNKGRYKATALIQMLTACICLHPVMLILFLISSFPIFRSRWVFLFFLHASSSLVTLTLLQQRFNFPQVTIKQFISKVSLVKHKTRDFTLILTSSLIPFNLQDQALDLAYLQNLKDVRLCQEFGDEDLCTSQRIFAVLRNNVILERDRDLKVESFTI